LSAKVESELFARVLKSPAVQSLARRVEDRGVLSLSGVSEAAQPFLTAVLHRLLPRRPIVVVMDGLKAQESFHQDVTTWLQSKSQVAESQPSTVNSQPLFYPAWEILPHEDRLPHSDVISERLETRVALSQAENQVATSRVVVTSVAALMQRTFAAGEVQKRTRQLAVGEQIDPLDLVEWLEDQGYEPEAQVTQKGELSLRGGILDLFPLTSPWPVRIEFFGDEIESLRYFDPLTQISREEIKALTVPPGGELGILKKREPGARSPEPGVRDQNSEVSGNKPEGQELGTLVDYLPRGTIVLVCEPARVAERAAEYERQVPEGDPFFIGWDELKSRGIEKGIGFVAVSESSPSNEELEPASPGAVDNFELRFESLEAFRPVNQRPVEAVIAEAQRREFFEQLHRWLRQDYAVQVFCNTDGEGQRFSEVWEEYGLGQKPGARSQEPGAASRCVVSSIRVAVRR
jgi:transcription-repair coupling factor (superfamily II helicase)